MRSPSRENKERIVKNEGDEKACERERVTQLTINLRKRVRETVRKKKHVVDFCRCSKSEVACFGEAKRISL